MPRTRTRRGGPSRESLLEVGDVIARKTAGFDGGPLRFDAKLLDDDERAEIVALTQRVGSLSASDGERWQALVEKGTGKPGLFARLREAAEIGRDLAALAVEVSRRPFSRAEETGVFREVGKQVAAGCLLADHVALLSLILTAYESGQGPPRSRARVERAGDDPVLVFDPGLGAFGGDFDPTGDVTARWRPTLEHLEANSWLTVTRNGNVWRVAPGVRLRRALAGSTTVRRAA